MKSCALKPYNEQPSTNFRQDAGVLLSPFIKPVGKEESPVESLIQGMKETSANPSIPEMCRGE
ncbi:hypothetical protein DPMN_091905 [Dreissena polymorpha]|nr:hypothetical protein DPMN_091905 [Dreissena polymorpha]